MFYGGLLAAAEQARRSGDATRAEYLERRALDTWMVHSACHFQLQLRGVEHTLDLLERFPSSLNLYLLFGEPWLAGAIEQATLTERT